MLNKLLSGLFVNTISAQVLKTAVSDQVPRAICILKDKQNSYRMKPASPDNGVQQQEEKRLPL